MSLRNITLINNSILVKRDEPLKQTTSGIFLGEDSNEIIDTGVIVKVGPKLITKEINGINIIGFRIRFREAFAEELDIKGEKYLFFRDLEPSVYYFINNEEDKE